VSCQTCTRECTEPHTGTAFEPVYTRFFEGVEVGNPSDGYLTATGDSDSSDPYNGMDGTGPWFQQVGGGFSDGGSYGGGTRFPCTYRFSFWRSSYTLGVGTIPPASTALTENVITVTVSTGAVVFPDGRVITSADGAVTLTSVPLVSGGVLAADPRTNDGTVSLALQCQNTETTFSVQARIRWATQKRQHVLYGIVRECYEEENPCLEECSGSATPDVLYVTISNYTGPTPDGTTLNGTYVLDRIPNNCYWWDGLSTDDCLETPSTLKWNYLYPNEFALRFGRLFSGACYGVGFTVFTQVSWDLCLSGVIATGTDGTTKIAAFSGGFSIPMTGSPFTNSFDWKIEA
jgi:hypothetical protein